jgi:YgiT-type zinc finger domain-containing protein
MICTNCFEAEYKTTKTELTVTINGESHVLRDLDCETCPACGEITFTHAQSLVIDKKRISLEFGLKPLLAPDQLKTLRRVLDMKLEDICDLLHIGRNTYGRWERGEVEITPSMNLLVHILIVKVPIAGVNLLENERVVAINKANAPLLVQYVSFGEYIREVITATKLLPDVVCNAVGIELAELVKIENNEVAPEQIPPEVAARIARFFELPFDNLKRMLNEAFSVFKMKNSVTAVHARSTSYDAKGAAVQSSSINKIVEKLAQKKAGSQAKAQVSEEYLEKVRTTLDNLKQGGGSK